jgi:hypothetical protein
MEVTKLRIISGVEKTSWKGVSMTPGETALTRMPFGKGDESAFGGGVGEGAGAAAIASGDGNDVDDGAGFALDHGRRDGAATGHHAGEIKVEDLVPALVGDLGDALAFDERAGIVDEDIDGAESPDSAIDHGLDVFGAAHVGLDGERFGAGFFEFATHLFGAFFVVVVSEGDVRAEIGEDGRGGGSDAGRSARDKGDFARQIEIISHDRVIDRQLIRASNDPIPI